MDQLSAVPAGKMYNKGYLCQSILPFFIPPFHKQHTLKATIYMKQAMMKYTCWVVHSPLSQESPWVSLHCFGLQFFPDSSAALLFHFGRSLSFGFALPVASGAILSWHDCNWLPLLEEKRWFFEAVVIWCGRCYTISDRRSQVAESPVCSRAYRLNAFVTSSWAWGWHQVLGLFHTAGFVTSGQCHGL